MALRQAALPENEFRAQGTKLKNAYQGLQSAEVKCLMAPRHTEPDGTWRLFIFRQGFQSLTRRSTESDE
jgi:hypothetical protein